MKNLKFVIFVILILFLISVFYSCSNTMLSPLENFVVKRGFNNAYSYSVVFSFDGKEDAVKYMVYENEIDDPRTSRMIIDSVINTGLSYSYSRSGGYRGKTFYYWVRYSNGRSISDYSSASSVTL